MDLDELQQELLKEICRRGGATLQELRDHFVGVPSIVIGRDLQKMHDAGLVRMVRRSEWTATRWEPTTEGIMARRSILA